MKIGTSFRTYSFRKKAIDDYNIENGETKIHENFNLIYSSLITSDHHQQMECRTYFD